MSVVESQCKASVNSGYVRSPLTGQFSKNSFHDATTFRSDYAVPPSGLPRRRPIEPLPPASVIPKNTQYERLNQSLTQSTYLPPNELSQKYSVFRDELPLKCNDMHKANFHISADKRLETRLTTNQVGFPPILHEERWDLNQFNRYKDVESGPLGNRVLNPSIQSEYCSVYKSGDKGCEKLKGAGITRIGNGGKSSQSTLTGGPGYSGRDHMMSSHRNTFRGAPLIDVSYPADSARRQQLQITSIPQGDRKKVHQLTSNTQASYHTPSLSEKTKAVRQINESSIVFSKESNQPIDCFSTSNAISFSKPGHSEKAVPLIRFSRNASFLPRGDLDPVRERERVNFVTTKNAHPKPPPNCYPTHIDSSDFHTLSHFSIGDSKQPHPNTYSSTVANSYFPISQPTLRARAPSKDNLPLNYYPGHMVKSTTADSYCIHGNESGNTANKLNPVALKNLKCSHWSLPTTGHSNYTTTHRDCFTAPNTSM